MDLSIANQKNLAYILKEMGTKLAVVNTTLFNPEDYNLEKYDDLKWLYDHLMTKDSLSVSETQAFIEELSTIRK